MRSRLYEGVLRHRRVAPRKHEFSYRVFMPYLCLDELHMYIFVEGYGSVIADDGSEEKIVIGEELGWRAYTGSRVVEISASSDCRLIKIRADDYLALLKSTPQLNYQTRKRLVIEGDDKVDWLLGEVPIY